ncbi:uncharacterized protein LOC136091830 [Hydra vulgaris]|uniref:Uncharacterized protein LOC136091830 n=1 Tax=Hydra vulgaris TaxID=6087 RepID=A0ABM4DM36_HYDVU
MIRNIAPKYQSKTDSIFLVGLWYALDAHTDKYSYYPILRSVISLLQQLESEQGVVVKVNGVEETIHAILILFSADNLGAHTLFGFMESFNAKYFCRFCKCAHCEIQTSFKAETFDRRTRAEYDMCVSESRSNNYNASESGIKHGCLFNCLSQFHCIDQSAVDCMHDVLEGVVPLEICLVLQSLIDKKYFLLADVNNAINNYNYSLSDKNSKPPEVNLKNIHIQAAESRCLIRNLPLIIGNLIPEGDAHWRLLLMLLDCMDAIFAPTITVGLIRQLEFNLEEHHAQFKTIYPEKRLIPKHHFMLHYPEFMLKYGPLSRYWCMRFEAKHRFAKELASVVRNFKNICKTIMHRSQLKLANTLFSNLQSAVSNSLRTVLNVDNHDEIYVAHSVRFGCYEIKPGCILCHDIVESHPQFGELKCIVSLAKQIYFVCYPFETLHFHEHFHSFEVKKSSNPRILLVLHTNQLKDYHPYNVILRCKFGLTSDKVVGFVYENDGTEVDEVDFEIIKHLAESNTILPISNLPLVLPSLQPSQSTLISSITFSESSVSVNNSHLMKAANEAFVSANSIKAFLAQHPSTCQYTEEVDSGKVSISTRQHIIRVVVHKMISAYGSYPDRYQKISVAAVLSEALVLPACIFYDSTNRHGFLERGLENARRKLPGVY